jgi:myosin-5
LVALNPFKSIPELYDEKAMKSYLAYDEESSPHVFKTTMAAYSQLRETRLSQSVLISGESGAGKTETTKQCLRMLGAVCSPGGRVEEAILSTNPVLESLGNAKTVRQVSRNIR